MQRLDNSTSGDAEKPKGNDSHEGALLVFPFKPKTVPYKFRGKDVEHVVGAQTQIPGQLAQIIPIYDTTGQTVAPILRLYREEGGVKFRLRNYALYTKPTGEKYYDPVPNLRGAPKEDDTVDKRRKIIFSDEKKDIQEIEMVEMATPDGKALARLIVALFFVHDEESKKMRTVQQVLMEGTHEGKDVYLPARIVPKRTPPDEYTFILEPVAKSFEDIIRPPQPSPTRENSDVQNEPASSLRRRAIFAVLALAAVGIGTTAITKAAGCNVAPDSLGGENGSNKNQNNSPFVH